MRSYRTGNLHDIIESLPHAQGKNEFKAIPLPDPGATEIYKQSRRLLEQMSHNPQALLGVITANYQRLEEGDIDTVFPDRRATAWLRAMHLMTEVAARLYEQNPYEFSQLERIASSLYVIDDYVRNNRHCPPELRKTAEKLN